MRILPLSALLAVPFFTHAETAVTEAHKPEITPATAEAVVADRQWARAAATPISTSEGKTLYTFGGGLPTVVCSLLRISVIELQPGEKLSGKPQIGDSVRWSVEPGQYGSGDEATTVLMVKAKALDLDTNLVIPTDRRIYYLRLVSRPDGHLSQIGFQYNDTDTKKWVLFAAAQRQEAQRKEQQAEILPAMITAEQLDFAYTLTGNALFRPTKVYNDGSKTYLVMPAEVQHQTAPALEVLGADGKSEMTNYRVKSGTYIVDRLFNRGQLVQGVGKKALRVEIARVQPQ